MSNSGGIPELIYNHPDGRQRTRLEMEQWLRQEIPKVHWLRIIANRVFGLEKKLSWDMREIVLKHWLLDEMVRRQYIVGDQLGINQNSSNDEAELRQFTQRLASLIQAGQAVFPQHVEGVDMTQFQPPPPPVMGGSPVPPNGQQAYPPGPPQPPGPPGGYAQPQPPPMAPPGNYAQPPQPPPAPQQAYAPPPQPQGPPGGYAPPPPAGPNMAGPPMGPPPGIPQAAPQPSAGGRRGGNRKVEQAGAPQQPPAPPVGPPAGFAPAAPPFPQQGAPAPGGFAPLPPNGQQSFQMPAPAAAPPQAPQVQQATVDPQLGAKIDQILTLVSQQATRITALEREVKMLGQLNTVLGRAMYQKPGSQDPAGFLTELGLPVPQ